MSGPLIERRQLLRYLKARRVSLVDGAEKIDAAKSVPREARRAMANEMRCAARVVLSIEVFLRELKPRRHSSSGKSP